MGNTFVIDLNMNSCCLQLRKKFSGVAYVTCVLITGLWAAVAAIGRISPGYAVKA